MDKLKAAREALEIARGYVIRSNNRWQTPDLDKINEALTLLDSGGEGEPDWRDDPSADDRWNAGLQYGQDQLCEVLGVDPQLVRWDAASETLDGDVQSVIGNILTLRLGEDWISPPDQSELAQLREENERGNTRLVEVENERDVLKYKLYQAVNVVQPMLISRAERAEALQAKGGAVEGHGGLWPKWYTVDNFGDAALCDNKENAEEFVRLRTDAFPDRAPFRAVQLAPAALSRPTERAVTEAELIAEAERVGPLFVEDIQLLFAREAALAQEGK